MIDLGGKAILIMATHGFEESELTGPRELLSRAGATVKIAAPSMDPIQARVHDEPTIKVDPDMTIDEVDIDDFDALILPGGVINPDSLRRDEKAVALVRRFDAAGKVVAAICHGPWMLVEADVLRGRRATSWPSIRTDMRNAGAELVDEAACVDGRMVTSRQPEDVPAFCDAISRLLCGDEKSR
ncbi:type 1 glutamine amidotransferase domain-containing protein [Sphingomicrobium lutaoense]|uniref:Protease I n=1 Tax=Sphingomicrobium lutaoense TaxID=515949 RepID=A0A839YWH4_9SPHN|nr:type 1 glutamine amidotransferase domain-containing protein [Sphingomicrobium lutaoense]MBB3763386.1 protease I [Sphingomicrobium lutaoense]